MTQPVNTFFADAFYAEPRSYERPPRLQLNMHFGALGSYFATLPAPTLAMHFGELGSKTLTLPESSLVMHFGEDEYLADPPADEEYPFPEHRRAGRYYAGLPIEDEIYPVPEHRRAGRFSIGDLDVQLVTGLYMHFGLYAGPPRKPTGIDNQSLIMRFGEGRYIADNYPPVPSLVLHFGESNINDFSLALRFGRGYYATKETLYPGVYRAGPPVGAGGTVLTAEPALYIETVRPFTEDDARLNSWVLGEAILD